MSLFHLCLILFSFTRLSDSLFCYVCTNCNDPFQAGSYIGYSYPDNSGYYCRKTSSSGNVTRDASTTCVQSGTSGNGQWCCQTTVCNTAPTIEPNAYSLLILILFLLY